MSADKIAAFFKSTEKRLPALPTWQPNKARLNEMRARLPIEVGGSISGVEMEITLQTFEPEYLVIVLIAPACIARLCMSGGHRNRVTGAAITGPHFHHWEKNKHLPKREASTLPFCDPLPSQIVGRDAAFAWFLEQVGIESPSWLPVNWPEQGGFF